MMKKTILDEFAPVFAKSYAAVVLCVVAVILPQVILRPAENSMLNLSLFIPVIAGLALFALTAGVTHQLNVVIPQRYNHELVAKYLGARVGRLFGGAQMIALCMLVLLGVELIMLVLQAFTVWDVWKAPLSAFFTMLLALPCLFNRPVSSNLILRVLAILASVLVTVVVLIALTQEISDPERLTTVSSAIAEMNVPVEPYTPLERFESFLVACMPAAAMIILGERILVHGSDRRVRLRDILPYMLSVIGIVLLTLYIAVKVLRVYLIDTVPVLEMTRILLPSWAWWAIGVCLLLLGASLVVSSYWQLPRLLRELAIGGILPRKLGVQDERISRRLLVLFIAIVASISTYFLNSARFVTVIFILTAYVIAILTCLAMMARSRYILRNSTGKTERTAAKRLFYIFGFYTFLLGVLILSFVLISVQYVWWTFVLLLAPMFFLGFYQRGLGKVNEAVSVENFLEQRDLPTRIHGVVLVNALNEASLKAIDWALAMRLSTVQAVCVDLYPARTKQLQADWEEAHIRMNLTILGTPAGAMMEPVLDFIRRQRRLHPHEPIMVIYPRLIADNEFSHFISRHFVPRIIKQLRREAGVIISEVPHLVDFTQDR